LILLDIIMCPGKNGCETYKKIIEIHHRQKAIIITGFAETNAVKEDQQMGEGQYIKKSYTLEKIGIADKDELKNNRSYLLFDICAYVCDTCYVHE